MACAYMCLLLLALFCSHFQSTSGKCLNDQKSYLLRFRDGLNLSSNSEKLMSWDTSVDCCEWGGVACDGLGRVVSLELDAETASIRNENWKTLFSLQYLEKLSLALNQFYPTTIPMELHNLTKLQHLNLSRSGFSGQIPIGLSRLNSLVTLDLSSSPGMPLDESEENMAKAVYQEVQSPASPFFHSTSPSLGLTRAILKVA